MPRPNKRLPTRHATHVRHTKQIKRGINRTNQTRLSILAASQGRCAMRQASLKPKAPADQSHTTTENRP